MGFVKKYLCWHVYEEPYFPHKIRLEKIVGSISNFNNIYESAGDISNSYRNMVIDAMRMNCYLGEDSCSIPLVKEPRVDTIKFFKL